MFLFFFFFKQKTAYEMRISGWSSDVCSSDLAYNGLAEASKVPPEWHGWLHHLTDTPPEATAPRYAWQKEHMPNLTGTRYAYRPPGHVLQGGKRERATGDYEQIGRAHV